jgi:hypothetical protein
LLYELWIKLTKRVAVGADLDWIAHMLHKFDQRMPSWIMCIWDTFEMSKATKCTTVTPKMAKAGKLALQGNKNHSLPELFKAIEGNEITNHHAAGDDAKSNVPLAKFPPFWDRRFNKKGGLRIAADELEGKQEGIKRAAKSECFGVLVVFFFESYINLHSTQKNSDSGQPML